MDLDQAHLHKSALVGDDSAEGDLKHFTHRQFVRDYSIQIRMVRNELGAADAICAFRS